jgi:methionyl aminopeptidase
MSVELKSAAELELMRQSGRINAQVRALLMEAIRPGVDGFELDRLAKAAIAERGAEPTFVGYAPGGKPPYPGAICYSVNEELVHGIPSRERVLQAGDIISLDCGTIYQGYVGDSAFTMGVGAISEEARRLLEVTEQALYKGIEAARAGAETADISRTVQKFVESRGFNVVREYTGHGVGRTMHEDPQVPNWWPAGRQRARGWRSVKLQPGVTFALEPMVMTGRPEVMVREDFWTVVTRDGSLCAHFEHTIAITPQGPPLILTAL